MVPLLVLHLLGWAGGPPPPLPDTASQAPGAVCVVVNLRGDPPRGSVDMVRRIFQLRQRFWPDGTPTRPVNLPPSSPVRERFTEVVFGESVEDMAAYWNERYFHGTRPPPSLGSQQAVLLYVARTKGGIGYMQADRAAVLPEGVKKLICIGGETG
jgi:hypothetical protein